jgi:hypothetical protein
MYETYDDFIRRDEAHARHIEQRVKRSLIVDYEDGGELKCGACGGTCYRHYRQDGRNDIGECCVKVAA